MEKTSIKIVKILKKAGYDAYWAGGCVRDVLMKREPMDYDIVTNAKPDIIEDLLEHTIPIGKEFGVILAIEGGHHFEIATFRSDSGYSDGRRPDAVEFTHAEDDAKRRDFTINGMFYDPLGQHLLDFIEGKKDIRDRLIRFIGDPHERILEDHLRIIRAIRFKTTLDFQYHPDTYKAILKHAELADKVSNERLRDELNKMMMSERAVEGWEDMEDTGVLKVIMPELLELKGLAQPAEFHHEGDAWDHTMKCLGSLGPDATLEEKWAVMLHDIAKPQTFMIKERIRYDQHPQKSAEMAEVILRRLKFPAKFIKRVCFAIEHHFNMKQIIEMNEGRRISWFKKPAFPLLMTVFKADIAGTEPSDYSMYEELLALYEKAKKKIAKEPKKLLSGEDVMVALGIGAGPELGEVLDELHEAQLAGTIKTKKQALKWLKSHKNN
ncbi:MAG: CCA tRNA nucleotidyltransferase [Patescibacteria group bacterium]|nr:CCA tRNA nucleotidyltransferase [Patescibacteria group bacterium]